MYNFHHFYYWSESPFVFNHENIRSTQEPFLGESSLSFDELSRRFSSQSSLTSFLSMPPLSFLRGSAQNLEEAGLSGAEGISLGDNCAIQSITSEGVAELPFLYPAGWTLQPLLGGAPPPTSSEPHLGTQGQLVIVCDTRAGRKSQRHFWATLNPRSTMKLSPALPHFPAALPGGSGVLLRDRINTCVRERF
jgi:hypothetical protein